MTPADLRSRYQRDGFVVLDRFVDESACEALRARADALVAAFEPASVLSVFSTRDQARTTDDYFLDSGEEIRFFFEAEAVVDGRMTVPKTRAINKIGHALHDLDPVFSAFSRTPALAELVAALGVVDPRLIQSMYIFKQPHIGGEVGLHQDATFLHTSPDTVVGLWFALEDATRDNGCLWVVPGGHAGGLRTRFVPTADRRTRTDVLDATPFDTSRRVPLEVRKGSLVVLHGLLPHASEANRSPVSRHAYTLHVISGESEYLASNWLQRKTPPRGF
jgi:phytanoyl-CoA hydroxylase